MPAEKRYSIILEHTGQVLLGHASLSQIESFWDANDTHYFGLRIEDEQSDHARVFVTDVIPEEEEETLFA
ncbi:hypothetical protein [Pseudomonas saudiphocaensis]|uniref:hypothetical protein n=1 Tax=Pseudomonas saudiphocaensis TaxID=1499686 RepID=UPI000F78D3BF|nr:hypothetical protein [Pseudomonas saudiphocaensis]RRV16389.1 hypothetical protein EGJ00_07175 [Pseudomonas saudiphocaensis]